MSESTKYEGHNPSHEDRTGKVVRAYDMPLKVNKKKKARTIIHKVKSEALENRKHRYIGDINR